MPANPMESPDVFTQGELDAALARRRRRPGLRGRGRVHRRRRHARARRRRGARQRRATGRPWTPAARRACTRQARPPCWRGTASSSRRATRCRCARAAIASCARAGRRPCCFPPTPQREARERAQIAARGQSSVTGGDSARLRAYEQARVAAYGEATVQAWGFADVARLRARGGQRMGLGDACAPSARPRWRRASPASSRWAAVPECARSGACVVRARGDCDGRRARPRERHRAWEVTDRQRRQRDAHPARRRRSQEWCEHYGVEVQRRRRHPLQGGRRGLQLLPRHELCARAPSRRRRTGTAAPRSAAAASIFHRDRGWRCRAPTAPGGSSPARCGSPTSRSTPTACTPTP